jgi:hypothetical protein
MTDETHYEFFTPEQVARIYDTACRRLERMKGLIESGKLKAKFPNTPKGYFVGRLGEIVLFN